MNFIAGFTAFFLGALHALEPGHGKSAIAAYAVGHRSSSGQILVLGLSAAIAHTATILALALILGATVSAANDQARLYIEIGSAALLVGTGAWLWRRALKAKRAAKDCNNSVVECDCRQAKLAAIDGEKPVTFGAANLLGISVGLLPCPTALAVLIASMTAGHFFRRIVDGLPVQRRHRADRFDGRARRVSLDQIAARGAFSKTPGKIELGAKCSAACRVDRHRQRLLHIISGDLPSLKF